MNLKFFLFAFFTIFSLPACGQTERFYCYFYKGRDSVSDRMVLLSQKKFGRTVNVTPFWTLGMKFYKTYDKGHEITTTYTERRPYRYSFFKMDLSGTQPVLLYGYGLHILAKDFERTYALPYTSKNFNQMNANPELKKYLPPAPHADYLSISFYKRKLDCRKINLLEYSKNFAILIFYYILAGA